MFYLNKNTYKYVLYALYVFIINLLKFKEVDIMLDIISIDIELLMGGLMVLWRWRKNEMAMMYNVHG